MLKTPTKPRNDVEKDLLERIDEDPDLRDASLRREIKTYLIEQSMSLTDWFHQGGNIIVRSFEDKNLAEYTQERNQRKNPYIIGITSGSSLN